VFSRSRGIATWLYSTRPDPIFSEDEEACEGPAQAPLSAYLIIFNYYPGPAVALKLNVVAKERWMACEYASHAESLALFAGALF
jgi:hypothetical protein